MFTRRVSHAGRVSQSADSDSTSENESDNEVVITEHHEDDVDDSLGDDENLGINGVRDSLTTHELEDGEFPITVDTDVPVLLRDESPETVNSNTEQSSSATVAYDDTPVEENAESDAVHTRDSDVPEVETLENATDGWDASPIVSQQDHCEDVGNQLDFTFDHFGPDTSEAHYLQGSQHLEPETSTAIREAMIQEQRRSRRNRGVPRERLDL